MKSRRRFRAVALLVAVPCAAAAGNDAAPGWEQVREIFQERCVMCHSALAGASKGLRLDSYTAALEGGDSGAVLIPGDATGSELARRLRGLSVPRMPFLSRPLPESQIALIERWIEAGLPEAGSAR